MCLNSAVYSVSEAVSLEPGICHLKGFFSSNLTFAMTKLTIIELLVCYAIPIQLGQIFALNLKDEKYLGKKPTKTPSAIYETKW